MRRVFVDTAAWIALLNTRDALHAQATRVFVDLRTVAANIVTTEFVLIEVANALSAPPLRSKTVTFVDALRQERAARVVAVDAGLVDAGWRLYRQRPDKEWGLTDCISFAVMTEEGITDVLTSDHHFTQAGFQALL